MMDIFLIVLVIAAVVGVCVYVFLTKRGGSSSHYVPPAPTGPEMKTTIPAAVRPTVPPAPAGRPAVPPAPKRSTAPKTVSGYKTAPATVAPMDDYISLYSFREAHTNWRCPVCDGENAGDDTICQVCGRRR
ncbi:MAG: hypothetical protein ACI3V3_09215 [Faecousia sp.]